MTALVIEGVSVLDLEELDEVTCSRDNNPAVVMVTHAGCTSPTFYCDDHHARLRELMRIDEPGTNRTHLSCGQSVTAADLTVRPI